MSKLKIYGVPGSRTMRCLWMANELGLDYKNVPVKFGPEGSRKPDFLKINPNGHIPAIDDDGLILWESMAINLYLAEKHGGPLWPASAEDRARALMWSFWAMTEAETPVLDLLMHRAFLPEAERDPKKADEAEATLKERLKVLEGALEGRDYLLGGAFTVADLNVASVLSWIALAKVDLSGLPRVQDWFGRATSRQALAAARQAA